MRGRRGHIVLDALLVLWAALWIFVGVQVAKEVRSLANLGNTVGSVGRSVQGVGSALRSLDSVPIIGGRLGDAAGAIEGAGRDTTRSAARARADTRDAGTLLGISIAIIPTLPLLLLYVPGRLGYVRDREAIRRALARGDDPALEEVLAVRAMATLPYHRLRRLGRGELADAELARLGLRRRAARR